MLLVCCWYRRIKLHCLSWYRMRSHRRSQFATPFLPSVGGDMWEGIQPVPFDVETDDSDDKGKSKLLIECCIRCKVRRYIANPRSSKSWLMPEIRNLRTTSHSGLSSSITPCSSCSSGLAHRCSPSFGTGCRWTESRLDGRDAGRIHPGAV